MLPPRVRSKKTTGLGLESVIFFDDGGGMRELCQARAEMWDDVRMKICNDGEVLLDRSLIIFLLSVVSCQVYMYR